MKNFPAHPAERFVLNGKETVVLKVVAVMCELSCKKMMIDDVST